MSQKSSNLWLDTDLSPSYVTWVHTSAQQYIKSLKLATFNFSIGLSIFTLWYFYFYCSKKSEYFCHNCQLLINSALPSVHQTTDHGRMPQKQKCETGTCVNFLLPPCDAFWFTHDDICTVSPSSLWLVLRKMKMTLTKMALGDREKWWENRTTSGTTIQHCACIYPVRLLQTRPPSYHRETVKPALRGRTGLQRYNYSANCLLTSC